MPTQAERRAHTREALLTATIAALVEVGYARLTTRGVAARAGVTPGALQHHFASKADLVADAVGHLNAGLTQDFAARLPADPSTQRRLARELLDALWEVHKGPLMAAMAELLVAARTDPELRERLVGAQREALEATAAVGAHVFPDAPAHVVARLLDTALAAQRGLALLGFVDEAAADAMWEAARGHVLDLAFAPANQAAPA